MIVRRDENGLGGSARTRYIAQAKTRTALVRAATFWMRERREHVKSVHVLACAAGVLAWCSAAMGTGFDAIGGNPLSTNGAFWLTSATNTDAGGDATAACGVGLIVVPAGQRVTEIEAVIGTRGPGGGVSINFASVSDWRVSSGRARRRSAPRRRSATWRRCTTRRPRTRGMPHSTARTSPGDRRSWCVFICRAGSTRHR